ncbi:MAG: N-acyl homoserine lactonase family protein [Pseudomonadota bacterium]
MLTAIIAAMLPFAAPAPEMAMWRLDCGKFVAHNMGGKPRDIPVSCYLIRHGDSYMLWDAGMPRSYLGKPEVSPEQTISLDKLIVDQLAQIGVRPDQVKRLGISHYHGDHIGQAPDFPGATLLIGRQDFEALTATPKAEGMEPELIASWIAGKSSVVKIERDTDVFGDGTVTILTMPGHTPGHTALMVRIAGKAYLLTGDLYHFAEQIPNSEVSGNATDPAAAKLSMARFQEIARANNATIIVQHDAGDIAKLPLFPESAH